MLFLFDHVGIDQEGSKWNTVPFEVKNLRDRMTEQQEAVRKAGWASLFFCNHDQPRVVSRWGNDTDRESRELSAKAFGMVLHMHRGIPYIYEGEELGMTNAHFTKLEQYRADRSGLASAEAGRGRSGQGAIRQCPGDLSRAICR